MLFYRSKRSVYMAVYKKNKYMCKCILSDYMLCASMQFTMPTKTLKRLNFLSEQVKAQNLPLDDIANCKGNPCAEAKQGSS